MCQELDPPTSHSAPGYGLQGTGVHFWYKSPFNRDDIVPLIRMHSTIYFSSSLWSLCCCSGKSTRLTPKHRKQDQSWFSSGPGNGSPKMKSDIRIRNNGMYTGTQRMIPFSRNYLAHPSHNSVRLGLGVGLGVGFGYLIWACDLACA